MPRLCSSLLLSLLIASSASAEVTIEWVTVLDQGNPCSDLDPLCRGTVNHGYDISVYEITNAQYAEFLNAKAASDPLGLYSTSMSSGFGGITRSGSDGSYSYSPIGGRENMPVNWVTYYDALRFANWLHNDQGSGDTETGAYTLLGGTATPSNAATIRRKVGVGIFLPNESEWVKAAYYNAATTSYFVYPAASSTEITCAVPTAAPNRANCDNAVGDLTPVGSYPGSTSPYGTFDQGGNVWEMGEVRTGGFFAPLRGGSFDFGPEYTAEGALGRSDTDPTHDHSFMGFRVLRLPEPTADLLRSLGAFFVLGLATSRRGPQ